jgi:hypothetical protein
MEPVIIPPPDRFCDVVMKGGITSGVVYPLAVARLAERFRLKNIGGTSAGAIAAAAAAAAELGRNTGGYERLKELPSFLSGLSPDGKNTNLFAFFQPQPETRALFNIATSALGGGCAAIWRVLQTAAMEFPLAAFLGSVPAICLLFGAWLSATGVFFFVCLLASVALLVVGVLAGLAVAVAMRIASALPKNFYGLCTGMTEAFSDTHNPLTPSQGKPLTFWLTEYLNEMAGRKAQDPLLTFGDLWGTRDSNADRQINLEMMTTCVTHGRPYRLPFRDDEDLNENQFYFCRDEFERLFPKRVVEWLLARPREIGGKSEKERTEGITHRSELAKRGIHPMPAPADLPVVVAVRMSLSFPILLSAIPLHAIERRRDPEGMQPERCWFSDGGVCSNLPLHFFDSALPRHPTLSINLSEAPNGTKCEELVPEMVENNQGGNQERWKRFESHETLESGKLVPHEKSGIAKISGFVWALITTMQNWTDNTQSRLPGFRDRIVHVPLTPDEGGLNLNMPRQRIEDLTKRGEKAGSQLLDHFAVPATHAKMTWDNHRWLRMRSMMASLEKLLSQADRACQNPEGQDLPYDKWIESGAIAPSYGWENEEQRRLAAKTLSTLRDLARQWRDAKTTKGNPISAADNAPRPRPELRPRAQI